MSSRIQKIKDTYSKQFQQKLKKGKVDISLDSAWDVLISADPTKTKKNVRWMIEVYLNNGYLWEDIASGPASKVSETITEFEKHKRNLEPAERSLNKYQSLGALWKAIKPYVGQMTAGEEKRADRDKAYDESEVVVDREDGLKIIVPKTEYAAKWFGKGTRWCTAADNDNAFCEYAEQSPLFIILMPNGDKLQIWKSEFDVQFMDENDEDVTEDYIEEHWEHLKEVVLWANLFDYIPEHLKTYELCMEAVRKNGWLLSNVPQELQTYEMCKVAVENSAWALKSMRPEFKTKELCEKAVSTVGEPGEDALSYVPRELKTKELCELAVRTNGSAIFYVPQKLKTKELYDMAFSACRLPSNLIFKEMPMAYITPEICSFAVKNMVDVLSLLPKDMVTSEICKEAIMFEPSSLVNVVKEQPSFVSYDLCEAGVLKDGRTLKHVPKDIIDEELCKKAVSQNIVAFQSVPEQYRTHEVCSIVVTGDEITNLKSPSILMNILRLIPKEFCDEKTYKECVNKLLFAKEQNYVLNIPEKVYEQEISDMKALFAEHSLTPAMK